MNLLGVLLGDRLTVRGGQYGHHDTHGRSGAEQAGGRRRLCPLPALLGATFATQRWTFYQHRVQSSSVLSQVSSHQTKPPPPIGLLLH